METTRCSKTVGRGTCKSNAALQFEGNAFCEKHAPAGATPLLQLVEAPRQSRSRQESTDSSILPSCLCGCGIQVLNKNRTFRQGHDQRYRGHLLKDLEITKNKEEAEAIIRDLQRSWEYTTGELQERAKEVEWDEN